MCYFTSDFTCKICFYISQVVVRLLERTCSSRPGSAFSSPSNIFRLSALYPPAFLSVWLFLSAPDRRVCLVDQRHVGVCLATALQGISSIDLRFRVGVALASPLCRWYLLVQNSGNNICRGCVLLAWQRRGRSGPLCRDHVFLRRYLLPHLICILLL